ncbi:MAG: YbaK/EbsC family protein [Anaerolineales bacterium]|jgi:Ala-tRNA(Pro) deacylase
MECRERLEQYLRENDVSYKIMTHDEAFTMQEVAAEVHLPGSQVAKVVMVHAGGRVVMLVVPSPYQLDFAKVAKLLGDKDVRLAKEKEFKELFPDCAVGAMPPFGNLYQVPVYVEQDLTVQRQIAFRVGTYEEVMRIAYADFAKLANPTVGAFAEPS